MCLQVVDTKPPETEGYGWKVFERVKGRLYAWIYRSAGPYFVGRWNKVENKKPINVMRGKYPTGFHIFKRKKDAVNWSLGSPEEVYKVHYRNAHTAGLQGRIRKAPCVVAESMRILPNGRVK